LGGEQKKEEVTVLTELKTKQLLYNKSKEKSYSSKNGKNGNQEEAKT